MTEEWRSIPGHPNHEASSEGRIRNAKRGNILKPKPSPSWGGTYYKVDLGDAREKRNKYIHHLVALAFHGTKGENVDHKNADRADNRAANLAPMTQEDNLMKRENLPMGGGTGGVHGDSYVLEYLEADISFNPEELDGPPTEVRI